MKISLTARDLGLDGTRFAWEVDLAHDDVLSLLQFFIEAGEGTGERGPWFMVNDEPVMNAFGYVSRKKFWHSATERTNYRVRAVNLAKGGEASFSNMVSLQENDASKLANHIAAQERHALRRLMGAECLHYAKMHFGPRCDCFDADLGKRTLHLCKKCFNTGFAGGYYYPTSIYITRGVTNKGGEPSQFGIQENAMMDSWTSNDSIIEVGDLLVMAQSPGLRYIVRQIQATSLRGKTIRQTLSLQRLGADAPEMMVPAVSDPADPERDDVFRRYWGAQ